jgi:polysaccharide biosynthesis protein PslG
MTVRRAHHSTTLVGRAAFVSSLACAALACAPAALAGDENAATTSRTFVPVADTYVDSRRPRVSHGSARRLRVSFGRSKSFLRFQVRGLEGDVVRATLFIRTDARLHPPFAVWRAKHSTWREGNTTFRRSPRIAWREPGAMLRPGIGGWKAVDVTRLVRKNGTLSLVLFQHTRGAALRFRSRETPSAPKLVVESLAEAPSRTPTSTPPAGDTPPPVADSPAEPTPPAPTPPAPTPPAPTPPPSQPAPPPAPAPVSYRGRFGMSASTMWYSDSVQRAYLQRLADANITWVREDFAWEVFEPRQGVWDWSFGDRFMRNASRTGVNALATLAYSAPWAASGPTIYHPPRDPAQYAAFAARLVARYGPGGAFWAENPTLTPRPLTAIEIWNEPWLNYFWRPEPDPAAYLRLSRATIAAVRAANPNVKILISGDIFQMRGDTTASLDWFRLLAEQGPDVLRSVDAYSVHLYTQDRSPLDTRTEQRFRFDRALMTRDIATRAGASRPLWVTEFGWTTGQREPDPVSEELQARYTREALTVALEQWGSLVERSFLYYWGDPAREYTPGYSPLRADGSAKPLWTTLAALP